MAHALLALRGMGREATTEYYPNFLLMANLYLQYLDFTT